MVKMASPITEVMGTISKKPPDMIGGLFVDIN
jgi:hypothetical protein